jgi:hypothetical protein
VIDGTANSFKESGSEFGSAFMLRLGRLIPEADAGLPDPLDWPDVELLELLDAFDVEELANIDPTDPVELVALLGGDVGLHGGAELEPDAELVEDGLYRDRGEELAGRGEVTVVDVEEGVVVGWPIAG